MGLLVFMEVKSTLFGFDCGGDGKRPGAPPARSVLTLFLFLDDFFLCSFLFSFYFHFFRFKLCNLATITLEDNEEAKGVNRSSSQDMEERVRVDPFDIPTRGNYSREERETLRKRG